MALRVLHAITGLNVGGAEYMLTRFLGRLDRSRLSSTVVSLLAPGPLTAAAAASADVVSMGMTQSPRTRDALTLVRLVRLVRATAPDLVHGWMHHGNLAAMLGFSVAPVIWSVHHSITRLDDEKPMTQRILRLSAVLSSRTAAISYCSRVAAADHEKLGFDPRRRIVIPNGIDCQAFAPSRTASDRLRALIDVPAGRTIVGHVARLHPMKDQLSLVRAVGRLVAAGYDVQAVFVGEGHVEGPVRHAAREMNVDDRITTLGVRADVAELLPGFDLFALCSAWGEAFPLSVGEAMASGVPAVVTAVGDCDWLVGPTGCVVPPADNDALVAAIREIIDLGPDARRRLGEAARQRIVETFSLPLYVSRHLDLYEQALDGRRSRQARGREALGRGETA